MRKIMLIATFLGFAVTAYADGQQQPPPASVAIDQAAPQYYPLDIKFASMRGAFTGDCIIQIAFTVNGHLIQVVGHSAEGNGRGVLSVPTGTYNPDPDNRLPAGNFLLAGDVNDGAVLIEVRDPVTGEGLMAIFEMTFNGTGLEPASGKVMRTSGFALATFSYDVRTAGLNSDNLADRFERAKSAQSFLLRLANRNSPLDVHARPSCQGPCGGHSVVPGGPIVGPVGGLIDPSLVGGVRRY